VLESTRTEEERIKRETAVGLALFRKQQEEADKKARRGNDGAAEEAGSPVLEEDSWTAGGRKRKRAKEKEGLKGVKIRRSSTAAEGTKPAMSPPAANTMKSQDQSKSKQETMETGMKSLVPAKKDPVSTLAPAKGGLVNYGSDDDDDW
jgi:hypothetical protein